MRALAYQQCVPGLIPGPSVICGLSLLLVLVLAPRVFLLVLWFSSLLKKPTFLNSNSIENSRATGLSVEELLCVTLVKQSQFIYLFIYFTWLQMELFKLNHEVLKVIVGSLSTRVLRRGRQPEENISHAWTIMPPRFFYYLSLMAKRY